MVQRDRLSHYGGREGVDGGWGGGCRTKREAIMGRQLRGGPSLLMHNWFLEKYSGCYFVGAVKPFSFLVCLNSKLAACGNPPNLPRAHLSTHLEKSSTQVLDAGAEQTAAMSQLGIDLISPEILIVHLIICVCRHKLAQDGKVPESSDRTAEVQTSGSKVIQKQNRSDGHTCLSNC